MKKNISKLVTLLSFFIFFLVFSTLYYFDYLSYSYFRFIQMGLILVFFFQIGYYGERHSLFTVSIGRICPIIILFLFLLISCLTKHFHIYLLFYYFLLFLSSVIGGFIKRKKKC